MVVTVKMQCFGLIIVVLHMKIAQALTEEWDDKVAVLYPSLPIAAPWSKNEHCRNHSRILLQALNNFTLWAVQMLDASARQPGGVLFGNMYQLGNFNECLDVDGPVQSQYCLTKVTVTVSHTGTNIDPYIQKYDPESSVWDKIKNAGNPSRVSRSSVYQALCVPASCSHKDIEAAVSQHLQKYKHPAGVHYTAAVAPNLCHTSQQETFSFEDYIFICVMACAVMLVIAGTALDYSCSGSPPGTLGLDLLFCFSVKQNMAYINQDLSNRVDILRSMRFICTCIVVLYHRAANLGASPLWNLEFLEKEFQTVRLALMHRGETVVDNFFLISGFIVAYILLQELHRKRFNPLNFILSRIMRVLPALLVMIFFYATLFYKLGSGPRWDIVVGPERDYCQKNWWTNLLFINNYVNDQRMCLLQSYFLACDMHFFIIAIPVVILLFKRPSIGAAVLGGIILVSILIPFLVTYLNHKPALVNFYIDFLMAPRASDVYQSVYIKSHTRASPYFVGIALGYLLYNHLDTKQKIGVVPSVLLCGGAVCLLFGTMMSGIVFYNPARLYNPLEAGIFAGMHRFVWSLGISTFIVVITLGKLPVISSLLSSRLLLSLGSLSYCMFLIHPVFLYWSNGSLQHPEYFSYSRIVVLAAGDIVLSVFASLFLYLTIEAPCSCMTRKILPRKVATKQE